MFAYALQACYGHTEGTAGITGALLATVALQRAMAPGIVNLVQMNPYVEAAVADWRARKDVRIVMPRQLGPAVGLTEVRSVYC